jgi:hypothetical protein
LVEKRKTDIQSPSGLGMAGVMDLNAFRQETLAAALPAAGKNGATTLCLHAGAETELPFPSAFAGLIRPFHKALRLFFAKKRRHSSGASWSVNCHCIPSLRP